MVLYQCPKCGRAVDLPEGTYYCSVCGPDVIMRRVTLPRTPEMDEWRRARIQELRDKIQSEIVEEAEAAEKYRALAGELKAFGYIGLVRRVESIAEDEEKHRKILSKILEQIK